MTVIHFYINTNVTIVFHKIIIVIKIIVKGLFLPVKDECRNICDNWTVNITTFVTLSKYKSFKSLFLLFIQKTCNCSIKVSANLALKMFVSLFTKINWETLTNYRQMPINTDKPLWLITLDFGFTQKCPLNGHLSVYWPF